jgi:hypothetical protein
MERPERTLITITTLYSEYRIATLCLRRHTARAQTALGELPVETERSRAMSKELAGAASRSLDRRSATPSFRRQG